MINPVSWMADEDHTPETPGPAQTGVPLEEGRSAYLGFVAHEARNPLSTALWCSELLGRLSAEDRGGARGEKLAGLARRALVRLARLLEDHFLDERLAAGGLPLRSEPVPLREALEEAVKKAAPAGGCTVAVAESVVLRGDPPTLARALEAMVAAVGRDGAPVVAEAQDGPDHVSVEVRGAPLEAAALERPRKGSPSDPAGRSLALCMAAGVARAHGASLAVVEGALVLRWPGRAP